MRETGFELLPPPESEPRFTVETFSRPQAEALPERENEDAVVVLENDEALVAAALDGATSIGTVTGAASGPGGRFAAQTAIEGIRRQFASAQSSSELLLAANRYIADQLRLHGIDADSASPLDLSRASGTAVRIDKARQLVEVSHIGEAAALVVHREGMVESVAPPDAESYDATAIALAQKIAEQRGCSLAEALQTPQIFDLMKKSQLTDNAPDGSGAGVLNGSKNAERYIVTKSWPLGQIKQVLLLTDGLWLPTKQFGQEPDWQEMAGVINQRGLAELYRQVTALENDDTDLIKYPRFKKHDDASGVVITV